MNVLADYMSKYDKRNGKHFYTQIKLQTHLDYSVYFYFSTPYFLNKFRTGLGNLYYTMIMLFPGCKKRKERKKNIQMHRPLGSSSVPYTCLCFSLYKANSGTVFTKYEGKNKSTNIIYISLFLFFSPIQNCHFLIVNALYATIYSSNS